MKSLKQLRESPPWLVRIRLDSPGSSIIGAGMLCPDGHVITCAHVLSQSMQVPKGQVYIQFQYATAHDPIEARVVDGGWHPQQEDDTGDIAVLEVLGKLPSEAAPAPLCSTKNGVWNHPFFTYGYPYYHGRNGVPSRGTVVARAAAEWLQLEAASERGQGLEGGFSGAPVWDDELRGVLGIVVSRDRLRGDGGLKVDPRTGYAIPCDVVAEKYWKPLTDFLDVRDTAADAAQLESVLDPGLTADGTLPRIRDMDIYRLGVSNSKYRLTDPSPPYLPREGVDDEIREVLSREKFVLAVGDSKSGKSRTMLHLLGETLGDARLISPARNDPSALSALTKYELPMGRDPAVVWLDDLDQFLPPNGLDQKMLDFFAAHSPRIVVVGTITTALYGEVLAAAGKVATAATQQRPGVAKRMAGSVLERARIVRIRSHLTDRERLDAEQLYEGEDFTERGIGEQAVAAPLLEIRYESSRTGAAHGRAVLQAAIDWRRIGLRSSIPRSVLRKLFPAYLARVGSSLPPTDANFKKGLAWGLEEVAGSVALLVQAESKEIGAEPRYRAFDFIRAYVDGQGGAEAVPIPDFIWKYGIESQRDDDLLFIAFGALSRKNTAVAERVLAVACDSDDNIVSARAALMLGELLVEAGPHERALVLLEKAAASGVPDVVPLAKTDIANLLTRPGGDLGRAQQLLEEVIRSASADVVSVAQLNLGVLLMNRGDTAGARPLLEAALTAEDPAVLQLAQAHIGGLLDEHQQVEQGRALNKSSPELGPKAPTRAGSGWLTGDADVSKLLRGSVMEARSKLVIPLAQASLGGLMVNEGELDKAQTLLDAALASGSPQVTPLAEANLGWLKMQRGDLQGALPLFERAAQSTDPGVSENARVSLGWALSFGTDIDRSRAILEDAVTSFTGRPAMRAECYLGDIALKRGDLDDAEASYRRVRDSDERDMIPGAEVGLGLVAGGRGDVEGARAWLDPVASSGHPELAPLAADLLGDLYSAADDFESASVAYRQAVASGHKSWAPVATVDLAALLLQHGQSDEAIRLVQQLADSGSDFAPTAVGLLGDMYYEIDKPDLAQSTYERAIASSNREVADGARINLSMMLVRNGEVAAARKHLEEASKAEDAAIAARAGDILGDLLVEAGEFDSASAAYRGAISREDPVWSASARVDLAKMLLENDEDIEAAELLLRKATESPEASLKTLSHVYIAAIRLFQGSRAAADEQFDLAEQSGGVESVNDFRIEIAKDSFSDGELERAVDAVFSLVDRDFDDRNAAETARGYVVAARLREGTNPAHISILDPTGQPHAFGLALLRLGRHLFERDHIVAADELLAAAVGCGDDSLLPEGRARLGIVRLAQQRFDEAADLLRAALNAGNREITPLVQRNLATALLRQEHGTEARELLRALAASPDREFRPSGLLLLGRLAGLDGDIRAARRWLEEAIATDDADVAAEALAELDEFPASSVPGSISNRLEESGTAPAKSCDSSGSTVVPGETDDAGPVAIGASRQSGIDSVSRSDAEDSDTTAKLPGLPARILMLLAAVADAEGQTAEADSWRQRIDPND